MKFSKLLVLSALWLTATSAMATIVDGVRQRPVPAQAQEFAEETEFYLYNVKAHRFFIGANDYGTRASIAANGYKVKFVVNDAAPEGTLEFTDRVESKSNAWMGVFSTSDGQAIWVDNSSEAYRFWKVEAAADGAYRLSNPVLENTFLGWKGSDDDTRLYLLAADAANAGLDWWFVTEADYTTCNSAWKAMEKQFNKAAELKVQIDIAKSLGLDVTAETALYENEDATVDELDAAIDPLKQRIYEYRVANATYENPADLTTLIQNPNGDNDSNKGWKGSAPDMQYTVFEKWNTTFTTYQDIEDMPNGVYDITVHALHRLGGTADAYASWQANEPTTAFVYAKMGNDSVSVALPHIFAGAANPKLGVGSELGPDGTDAADQAMYVPNNRQAAEQYFKRENDPYLVTVPAFVSDGKLRIGVYKKVNKGNDWTPWDTWGLSYKGSSAEACMSYLAAHKATLPKLEDLQTHNNTVTQQYVTAFNEAMAVEYNVTNVEETAAQIKAWNDAIAALKSNVQLWQDLVAVVDSANIVGGDATLDPDYTGELTDWAEFEAHDILTALELTNEELITLIAEKRAAILEAKLHPMGDRDMTDLLVNPAFEQKETGWTGFKSVHQIKWGNASLLQMPTTGGTATNTCAEAFSAEQFDLYQIVKGAPVGVYEISVQGFCRHGRGNVAWNNYQNQTEYSQPGKFPVYVYLNAKQTPFKGVFEEPVAKDYYKSKDSGAEVYVNGEVEFPDGMKSAAVAFADGMYTQSAIGLVAREGDSLRIGVKGYSCGLNGEDDNWVIFDNFKLTWRGYQADVVQPALEEEIVKAQELLANNMGKTVFANLNDAISAAQASIGGEGKAMFNCLSDLFDTETASMASTELFKPLVAANTKLQNELQGRESHSAYAEAAGLYETVTSNMAEHQYENDEIETVVNQINAVISKLRMPDNVDTATDANPVDMTSLIENAEFDEGVDGWKGTEATHNKEYGLAEFHNKNFDFYQDLAGLPAGTYTVQVQAFYRFGKSTDDYENYFTPGTEHLDNGILYAKAFSSAPDTTFLATALQRLSSILEIDGYPYAGYDSKDVAGYVNVKTDTIDADTEDYLYNLLPNTMQTANDQFMAGYFAENAVTIKITEGQTLRIGLMKDILKDEDWTIFDNWTLTYYGADSQKEQSGLATGIEDLNLNEKVNIEYFTLDGRKANRLQKGIMIQKMMFSNGATVVRKVRR
jgi:hypothetical protein